MQSPFVAQVLAHALVNQVKAQATLTQALASPGGSGASAAEELQAQQLLWAIRTMASISQGLAPWLADGPTSADKDWAIVTFKARRDKKPRPAHFDAEIEQVLQDAFL